MQKPGSSARFLIFVLLFSIPSVSAGLSSDNAAHDGYNAFILVTFEKPGVLAVKESMLDSSASFSFATFSMPMRLNTTHSSLDSSASFDLVTFEQMIKLNHSLLMHSSKSSFESVMNYTNRTNISLTIILPSMLFEGLNYDVFFVVNNTGNQDLTDISLNLLNHSVILDLLAKESAIYSSTFTARNATLISANLTAAYLYRNSSIITETTAPLDINGIYFIPEQFDEDEQIIAEVKIIGHTRLNATIYHESQYEDFTINQNETKTFNYNMTAHNNTNFTIIIDAGTYIIETKKIKTGLKPDLSGEIYSDELIINTPISAANFTIRAIEKNRFSVIKEQDYTIDYVYRNATIKLWNATNGNTLIAYIDHYGNIQETNETNNKAEMFSGKKIYVSSTNPTYTKYAYDNLKGHYTFTKDYYESEIILSIGKTSESEVFNLQNLFAGFGHYISGVKYYNKYGNKPYNGFVNFNNYNDKKYIFVYGKSTSGEITALKRYVKGADRTFIADDDLDGVKVYDYLQSFSEITDTQIENALHDRMITSHQINTTSTSGIPLRLLHLTPAYSSKLVNYLQTGETSLQTTSYGLSATDYQQQATGQLPVVLAQGLWSNLYSWQSFGVELADSGRDVYLIEITGGPGQDCEDCPNYNYDDLTDDYLPALIEKVRADSGKNQLQYVGFSNGCRTALSSLQSRKIDPTRVETFVGVGCPGAFSELSLFARHVNESGQQMIDKFRQQDKNHLTFDDVSLNLDKTGKFVYYANLAFGGNNVNKISLNLFDNYKDWMKNTDDLQPITNLDLKKFTLISGHFSNFVYDLADPICSDTIVSCKDESEIFNNTNSNNKFYNITEYPHNKLPDQRKVKEIIKRSIK